MERDRNIEVKVGLFVALGIAALVVIFAFLGSEKKLFEKHYRLHSSFGDISGLRTGAAVRLAGMDVGLVTSIEFPRNLDKKEVHVHLRIANRFRERVRGDSIATIEGQGLLGDKFVGISLGSSSTPALEDGSWIETQDPVELTSYLDDVPAIMANVRSITKQIDTMLKGEDGEKAGQSIGAMLASLRNILQAVEEGEGVIHQLVYDPSSGANLKKTLASIEDTTQNLSEVTLAIKEGDGTLHSLIYEDSISKLLTSLRGTVKNIDGMVHDIKTGNGLIHDLVYTDGGQSLLANLTDASADIRELIASIKRGEGTIGGLIADPTIYQDVKSLLGKAERNKILKSYVRDTIRKNEQQEGLSDAGSVSD